MKVSWDMNVDKGGWDMPSTAHRTTSIMEANTDYSLFIPGLSGQLWSPTFYCLALNDNQLLSAPHIGYNPATAIKHCPGTLGITTDGKQRSPMQKYLTMYCINSQTAGQTNRWRMEHHGLL